MTGRLWVPQLNMRTAIQTVIHTVMVIAVMTMITEATVVVRATGKLNVQSISYFPSFLFTMC